MCPYKKGIPIPYDRIEAGVDLSVMCVGTTTHVIDICKDDHTLEHPFCPYQPLPKELEKNFNSWFRKRSPYLSLTFFLFMLFFKFLWFFKLVLFTIFACPSIKLHYRNLAISKEYFIVLLKNGVRDLHSFVNSTFFAFSYIL